MKFLTMGLEPRGEWATLDADEMNRRVRRHQQQLDHLAMTRLAAGPPGLIFATFGLSDEHEVSTVKCERGGHACLDGPFPETKEVVGGFDVVEFPSRADAIAWQTETPRLPSQICHIRPIREFWWLSGIVDRSRLMRVERWAATFPRTTGDGSPAGAVFMLTAVEDERVAVRRSESERKQIEAEQQLVVADYIRQRSIVDHEPGMWVGARLDATTAAATIRWPGGTPEVSDGVATDATNPITAFHIVACASQEEAVQWARRLAARDGEAIEIRPVRGAWWIYHE